MDLRPELEQALRELVAAEQFGVLATMAMGRLHTATILFAGAADWELVFAIRPATLKAQLAAGYPRVAFQVDNRAVTANDRRAFLRAGFEGTLRHVPRAEADWERYQACYAAKLPFGADLLAQPELELYVLTTSTLRLAGGGDAAEDVAVPPPTLLRGEDAVVAESEERAPPTTLA